MLEVVLEIDTISLVQIHEVGPKEEPPSNGPLLPGLRMICSLLLELVDCIGR